MLHLRCPSVSWRSEKVCKIIHHNKTIGTVTFSADKSSIIDLSAEYNRLRPNVQQLVTSHQFNPRSYTVSDYFLWITGILAVILTILMSQMSSIGYYFDISTWYTVALDEITFWQALLLVCGLTLLGSLIPVPTPYNLPVALFAAAWIRPESMYGWGEIVVLILAASFFKQLGDAVDWGIGFGTERIVRADQPDLRQKWTARFHRYPRLIPFFILLFGITPLPDEVLLVPLGIIHYPFWKTFLAMYIAAVIMFTMVALAGILSMIWLINITSGFGWIIGAIIIWVIWVTIAVMLKR